VVRCCKRIHALLQTGCEAATHNVLAELIAQITASVKKYRVSAALAEAAFLFAMVLGARHLGSNAAEISTQLLISSHLMGCAGSLNRMRSQVRFSLSVPSAVFGDSHTCGPPFRPEHHDKLISNMISS
jgi:hypothetical protein